MFKKKKKKIIKNVFMIPSTEAKDYLASIIKDVKIILCNDKFMEATKKIKVPENATIKDYENLVKKVVPSKVYNFLETILNDCFDNVINILSAIFVTPKQEYEKKSLEEMCEDISTLTGDQIRRIFSFFYH